MDSMKCFECCFKHLAGALSYGKEILSGHDKNNPLDHRIDFLGELVNCEHHLGLINQGLADELKAYRQNIQNKHVELNQADLEKLREFYKKVEDVEKNNAKPFEKVGAIKNYSQDEFSVIYFKPKNEQWFDLSYQLLKINCLNKINIYAVQPEIQLKDYPDIKVVKDNIYDLIKTDEITENFVYMQDNYFILRNFDFNFLSNTYRQIKALNEEDLRKRGVKGFCYDWDCKPQMFNKNDYIKTMEGITDNLPTCYFNINRQGENLNSHFQVVDLDRVICCSNKAKITSVNFCTCRNDLAFSSFKKWIDETGKLKTNKKEN